MTGNGMKSNFAIQEELNRISAQVEFEDFLSKASQVMEIYELFDSAAAKGLDYARGYADGFWAGRELDAKYQLARIESVVEKHLKSMRYCNGSLNGAIESSNDAKVNKKAEQTVLFEF